MKKPGKYLRFYYKCMSEGLLPSIGLCASLGKESVSIFDEDAIHPKWGREWYWGYDGERCFEDLASDEKSMYARAFTPFRQTIVLFLAAMNNEL